MQAAEVIAARKPAPTPLWMWVTWLALWALAWGGIAAIAFLTPAYEWGQAPFSLENRWIWQLRFEIMPVVGMAALIAPLAGLIVLLVRRWRPLVLGLVGAVAIAQFAYFGLEKYLQTAYPQWWSSPNGLEGWPGAESSEPGAR